MRRLRCRHVAARDRREEAVAAPIQIGAAELGFDGAADQARAFAQNRDRLFLGLRFRIEQLLLRDAAVVPQRLKLQRIDARALCGSCSLDRAGQRQIDIVAAEQDVLADRDALQRQSPSRSVTAISVKSVVPPPMSTTRIRSPSLTRSRQSGWRSIQA